MGTILWCLQKQLSFVHSEGHWGVHAGRGFIKQEREKKKQMEKRRAVKRYMLMLHLGMEKVKLMLPFSISLKKKNNPYSVRMLSNYPICKCYHDMEIMKRSIK